jgi:hypothetical protein
VEQEPPCVNRGKSTVRHHWTSSPTVPYTSHRTHALNSRGGPFREETRGISTKGMLEYKIVAGQVGFQLKCRSGGSCAHFRRCHRCCRAAAATTATTATDAAGLVQLLPGCLKLREGVKVGRSCRCPRELAEGALNSLPVAVAIAAAPAASAMRSGVS